MNRDYLVIVPTYNEITSIGILLPQLLELDLDILVVDEVLAVGDAEFQKKCLGKMGDLSKCEGRTVLFVSHNMESISSLCNKSILLDSGIISFIGDTKKAINIYNDNSNEVMLNSKIKLNFSEYSNINLTYLFLL